MDMTVLHGRSSGVPGTRLSSWITVSVLLHLLVLAAGGGVAPANIPYRLPAMTVDIRHLAAETDTKLPAPIPDIEAHRRALKPPPPPRTDRQSTDTRKTTAPTESVGAIEQPLAIDNYFDARDLDVRAEPLNEVLLYYPMVAYYRRLSGIVQFRLFINAQGGLDKAEMIGATPPGTFEEAAWDAVKKLQFTPARKNGRAVKSQKTIDVVFDPNEDFSKQAAKRPDSSAAEK